MLRIKNIIQVMFLESLESSVFACKEALYDIPQDKSVTWPLGLAHHLSILPIAIGIVDKENEASTAKYITHGGFDNAKKTAENFYNHFLQVIIGHEEAKISAEELKQVIGILELAYEVIKNKK